MGIFDRFRAAKKEDRPGATPAPGEPSGEELPVDPAACEPLDLAADAAAATDTACDTPTAESAPSSPSPKRGLLARLRQGLERTSQLLRTDIRDLFKREGELVDDAFLDRLFALLVRTDMGVAAAQQIRDAVRHDLRGRVVQMNDVLARVKQQLVQLMDQPDQEPIRLAGKPPTVIIVVGVNGSGKTTSIAKLAHHFRTAGKRVVLGAADTFRAAAVEQLRVWAERVGATIITGTPGSDPASVAHRAVSHAIQTGSEVCIVDTAGRLQTQANLMDQLGKIRRVIQKIVPEAPHEVLLVLDATAGQNGISQAQGFYHAVQCTGIILAKLDGTAKGGVVIPIRQQFAIPVKYVGVGEKPGDLAPFDAREFVEAMFAEQATSAAH